MKTAKIILSITIILLIIFWFITLKLQKENTSKELVNNSTVSRNKAIEILNQWEIEEVFQSHNLDVILKHKNWAEISTKEPNIDDVFEEIRKCGTPCENIILATE